MEAIRAASKRKKRQIDRYRMISTDTERNRRRTRNRTRNRRRTRKVKGNDKSFHTMYKGALRAHHRRYYNISSFFFCIRVYEGAFYDL